MHPDSQSVYCVEVSNAARYSWLLVPLDTLGRLVLSRDWSIPLSSGFQANLEGLHAIIHLMYEILKKLSGGFLILVSA